MSIDPVGRRPRSADLQSTLRLVALAAVSLGVVLLAAAAFVLSYEGIHHIALRAGVSPGLAKLYPLIFDVMLVVAGAAALALRGAGWWARCYAWGSLLILLAAMAVGNAVYASGTTLPAQPTKIAVAIIPWVLLLMAFGLLLEMLRHFRTTRSRAAADAAAPAAAVAGTVVGNDVNGGPQTAATQAAMSGGKARELHRVDLDTLLGPRPGEPPAIAILHGIGTGQNDSHQVDPVSYGEETGYVHPDSYLDEGEYSPHGDTGGPGGPDRLAGDTAGDATRLAGHGTPAEAPAVEAPAALAEAPATAAEPLFTPAAPATAAEPSANHAAPATAAQPKANHAAAAAAEPSANHAADPEPATEPLFTPAAPETAAEPSANHAAGPATGADPQANPVAPAGAAEAPATPAEPPTTPAEPPTPTAETPDAAPVASAVPVGAPAGEAASGTGNGLAAGGSAAGAKTPAGQDGAAGAKTPAGQDGAAGAETPTGQDGAAGAKTPAGQDGAADTGQGSADVVPEAVGAEGPALERIRSTPTRPEE